MTPRILTEPDLCARWICSADTLRRLRKAGLLPFFRAGRNVRYRLEDVEQYERTGGSAGRRGAWPAVARAGDAR